MPNQSIKIETHFVMHLVSFKGPLEKFSDTFTTLSRLDNQATVHAFLKHCLSARDKASNLLHPDLVLERQKPHLVRGHKVRLSYQIIIYTPWSTSFNDSVVNKHTGSSIKQNWRVCLVINTFALKTNQTQRLTSDHSSGRHLCSS